VACVARQKVAGEDVAMIGKGLLTTDIWLDS
jgi:hypothetical protein